MHLPLLLSITTLLTHAHAMGIPIHEDSANSIVREVVPGTSPANDAAFCTNCVHVGSRCNIGEGNCFTSEQASCTYCGKECGSICVRDGIPCEAYC
ncbi:hypothetical protein B0T18DRAFT_420566 [Schizothecium vesticola]|uniref:Uncharacterized protein n=1 Tax=Schizothecium vesticola TaxID=314040 RepID=A0AA40BP20_9PEZI|nr:hypothetical protein B0T18DRAFT_420566 [Schizothecium vesticola]